MSYVQTEAFSSATTPLAFKPVSAQNNYNFVQGEFEITVVSDGFITVPIDIVAPDGTPKQRAEILQRTGDAEAGLVESKTNIPLIPNATDLTLVAIVPPYKYHPTNATLS